MRESLLIELLTEELPPKALSRLSEVFKDEVFGALVRHQLCAALPENVEGYATPRRLALLIREVEDAAPERSVEEKIMPVAVALDAAGKPTAALLKKLEAKGIPVSELTRFVKRVDGKSETFFYSARVQGKGLAEVLAGIVLDALKKLPIPKLMRWGDSDHQFVRPVHGLVMLHGSGVVPGEVLGLQSGNNTLGHRFMSAGEVVIHHADDYAKVLEEEGRVIASFDRRREMIRGQLNEAAGNRQWLQDEALLDEVTALVEFPAVYEAGFEAEYLAVPQECLILTMKANQKYFPLFERGRLTNRFLLVSNMRVADPTHIVTGNARVVRPRLADAKFFYDQDRKRSLADRIPGLAKVVYHNKLGSQGERIQRVAAIASAIGAQLGGEELARLADQAALLAKADLLTDMVGEFPELQGIMGRYYALHDGLPSGIADAIEDHYKPRFAGDSLPRGVIGVVVALADKLETLVGLFGIGQVPTGDKDPFALRRHALGIIRMLGEHQLALDLDRLISLASNIVGAVIRDSADDGRAFGANMKLLSDFIYERLAGSLREQGYSAQEVDAVISLRPQRLGDISRRLAAVRAFADLPEARALAAANKRVGNILKKVEGGVAAKIDHALFMEPAEQSLAHALALVTADADAAFERGDYTASLQALAALKAPVDNFFNDVMVNTEEPALRANRLGLLANLRAAMNRIADLSRLAS
ncbi:glycine--tRNA ligase beta subunit [mine drainage metagenome]|uniref:glycine--tRNA ligase n=1 Tax=mine drainage metagenome TaxID=410659 RepID=A0A1J5SEM7_9ZZZZ